MSNDAEKLYVFIMGLQESISPLTVTLKTLMLYVHFIWNVIY